MKNSQLLLLLGLMVILNGCPIDEPSSLRYHSFGWKPDGSEIIAIFQDFNDYPYSNFGKVVVRFDTLGKETSRVYLSEAIRKDHFFDGLSFTSSGKEFFAEIMDDTDIFVIDFQSGLEKLIISGHNYITASGSGKLVLSSGINNQKDSIEITITSINGTVRTISKWPFSTKVYHSNIFLDNRSVRFLGDSLLAICYSNDSGTCSLAIVDTLFSLKFMASDDGRPPILPAFAKDANKVLYHRESGFGLYDFATNSTTLVKAAPPRVNSQDITPDGKTIVYTVNEEGKYILEPSKLILLDVETKNEIEIASGLHSSAQISPDGRRVAYFTKNADLNLILHVVPLP